MRRLLCSLALVSAALLSTPAANGQEPIRFARTPDVSPDGKLVAFSYLGDVWVVETIGGIARPVTMHQAHDLYPIFSPDGKTLAFSSNRNGGYDVYTVPVHGGRPKRLTFDSAADLVNGWAPDGKSVLFTTTRSTDYPFNQELYSVPADGGRVRPVGGGEGREGAYSPKADQIAYVRGSGSWYRKGYRGSSNDDVWVCNADGTGNRRLSDFNGQDNSPMWGADGQFIYYVSECHGNPANVVRQDAKGSGKPQLVTFHKDDSVRRARVSGNGEWIVYECGADLWLACTREGYPPRKLAVEVHADDKVNPERTLTFTQGATEYALTADERHVAFAVHGDLFVQPLGANAKAVRLTDSPANDHGIAWSPDAKKLIFISDQKGHEDLYLIEAEPADKKIPEATSFKIKQITDTRDDEAGVSFAPDGKRVAFVRAGKLWTMNPDGTDQKAVVGDVQVIDYEWSPDSKWFALSRLDGSLASELFLVPAAGGEAKNVTRHATSNLGVTWSGDGKKLAFVSERRGMPTMHVMSLQKPAVTGAPASSDFDWEDVHLRVEQSAPIPATEGALSSDGTKVAFRSLGSSNGDDLWVANASGGQLTRVTTGGMRPSQIQWSKRVSDLVYFRDGTGVLRMARTGGTDLASLFSRPAGGTSGAAPAGGPVAVPIKVRMTVRTEEEYTEMFDQTWRYLAEHFYDSKFHGLDWYAMKNKYRPLVKHVALKEDLYSLLYLMMGELNASHLGVSGLAPPPGETTADLGLLFDAAYAGPGLKVSEVLKRGPADKRGMALKTNDVIVAVDGAEVDDKFNLSRALNGKADETVVVQAVPAGADPKDPKARKRVELSAVGRDKVTPLMYDRWVERNARRVSELSKGKLGYIHIPSMDEAGLDRFVRSLYSDNFDKDAIVLDVRFNGGGFTHDQVLNYLGGKEHTVFRQRHGGEGPVLRSYDRKWTKPLVLLVNNRSYSDAEIFPSAFKTLGLGKVVGQPTGGFVIGTSGIRLIDGSLLRIPRIGVFTTKGVNMEKEGVTPDVLVEPHPDQIARGLDPQLEKAVEVLSIDVANWKKNNPNVAAKGDAGKPAEPKAGPVVMPPSKE